MRKIRYNVAQQPKVHVGKFVFYSSILALIAGSLLFLGVRNLWSSDKREALQKEQARKDRLRVEELTRKSADYEVQIRDNQLKWRRQHSFAVRLIDAKNFDIVERLDLLEELLPEGVMITNVSIDAEKDSSLVIQVAAESLERLVDTYEVFKSYGAEVRHEKEKEGMFNATLFINYKGKTPAAAPARETPAPPSPPGTENSDNDRANKTPNLSDEETMLERGARKVKK